jgi:hypothetical protein
LTEEVESDGRSRAEESEGGEGDNDGRRAGTKTVGSDGVELLHSTGVSWKGGVSAGKMSRKIHSMIVLLGNGMR